MWNNGDEFLTDKNNLNMVNVFLNLSKLLVLLYGWLTLQIKMVSSRIEF